MQGRPRQEHNGLEKFKALGAAAVPNTQGVPAGHTQTFTNLRPICLSSCDQHNISGLQQKLTKPARGKKISWERDGTKIKTRLRHSRVGIVRWGLKQVSLMYQEL